MRSQVATFLSGVTSDVSRAACRPSTYPPHRQELKKEPFETRRSALLNSTPGASKMRPRPSKNDHCHSIRMLGPSRRFFPATPRPGPGLYTQIGKRRILEKHRLWCVWKQPILLY